MELRKRLITIGIADTAIDFAKFVARRRGEDFVEVLREILANKTILAEIEKEVEGKVDKWLADNPDKIAEGEAIIAAQAAKQQ